MILQFLGKGVGVASLVAIIALTARVINKRLSNKVRLEAAVAEANASFEQRVARQEPGANADKLPSNTGVPDRAQILDLSRREETPVKTSRQLSIVDLSKPIGNKPDGEAVSPPGDGAGLQNIEQKKEKIAEVVRAFFQARTLSELLPVVRDSRRVKPLMEEYYQRNPFKTSKWKTMGWAIPVEERGFRFAYVQALFDDAPPVNVVIEENEGGGFEIDWESAVHYCELSWKDFQSKRPTESRLFRVIASKVEASDTKAGDRETTLMLKHPKEEGVVYGRFDSNDPRFKPLLNQLDLCQWTNVPVILRLCYPGPSSTGASVQIAGVEGKGWLILDEAPRS